MDKPDPSQIAEADLVTSQEVTDAAMFLFGSLTPSARSYIYKMRSGMLPPELSDKAFKEVSFGIAVAFRNALFAKNTPNARKALGIIPGITPIPSDEELEQISIRHCKPDND